MVEPYIGIILKSVSAVHHPDKDIQQIHKFTRVLLCYCMVAAEIFSACFALLSYIHILLLLHLLAPQSYYILEESCLQEKT